jgi:hypothetical protein
VLATCGAAAAAPKRPAPPRLAGNEPALAIPGQAIGFVGRLLDQADPLSGRPFQAPIIANITKQEIPAFMPPDRAFGGSSLATKAAGQFFDLPV